MVRWIDGFYGGLIAGATSALFYAIAGLAWLHDVSIAAVFTQAAQALPPFHAVPTTWALVGLGAVVYAVVAAVFGIVYALLARRLSSMWQAPGSVVWGLFYGLLVWWLLNDVAGPLTGATDVQPLWEGLAGTVLFYGIVLSEVTAVAHRRGASAAP